MSECLSKWAAVLGVVNGRIWMRSTTWPFRITWKRHSARRRPHHHKRTWRMQVTGKLPSPRA